jgi:hypothetical protein
VLIAADYRRGGHRDRPSKLQPFPEPEPEPTDTTPPQVAPPAAPLKRQARHLPRP